MDADEMEIALPVFFPLFSPPGAAGSSSKPGDGMMEFVRHPKRGVSWTNQLAIPRVGRPPVPRMPSVYKTEGGTVITRSVDCRRSPSHHPLDIQKSGSTHITVVQQYTFCLLGDKYCGPLVKCQLIDYDRRQRNQRSEIELEANFSHFRSRLIGQVVDVRLEGKRNCRGRKSYCRESPASV